MNFGESLAYWYLRLNGFFPLSNFVLHRHADVRHNADADLLAVRFPHVSEPVGGQQQDWDNDRFDEWQLGHRDRIVCVICEVKTGPCRADDIATSFSHARIRLAIGRFGILPPGEVAEVVEQLSHDAAVRRNDVTFVKVLMARHAIHNLRTTPCCQIELDQVIQFIKNRMERYRPEKCSARMFFPSELIQFFAWSAGMQVVERNAEAQE
jgi:hypothetical protein